MEDAVKMQKAKEVYEQFCRVLDAEEFHYKRHDEDLTVTFGARGEDLPIDFIVIVNPKAQVISLFSPMSYKIPEEKRVELATAVAIANNGLINGTFDYDIYDGSIRFRLVNAFHESTLNDEVYKYMLYVSAGTIDKYNDKFLALYKETIDLEKFAEIAAE